MKRISYYFLIVILNISLPDYSISSNFQKSNEKTTQIIFIKDDDFKGTSLFFEKIIELGYRADVVQPDSVSIEKLLEYDLVVLSTGNNSNACGSSKMRLALQTYIIKYSGKTLIEGGQTGYISDVSPIYFGFRNKVIMIDEWLADNGGDLIVSNVFSQSNLANNPNILPDTMKINYEKVTDQDVCTNNKFSQAFCHTTLFNNKVGILVAPTVENPKLINFFVYYSTFADREEGKNLLQNSLFSLIGKPVGIPNNSSSIPLKYKLEQNYPNPFNPGTTISYHIPVKSNVRLVIYDILGNEIEVLIDKALNAGIFELSWRGDSYAGGLYFYSLYINGKLFETRKMLLIK